MDEHAVVIAGGASTGLMLAAELSLARVDVVVVEPRMTQEVLGTRARGVHARTIEVLDQRGIADRFLSQGQPAQIAGLVTAVPLDMSDSPTRHPYGLALVQQRIEETLAAWVAELAVPIHRGREVTGFTQDDTGVDVALSDGSSLRAKYLVGCDGGRSLVRKRAGIEFPGWDATTSSLIAEGEWSEEPAWGIRRTEGGINALGKLDGGKRVGLLLVEPQARDEEPTLDALRSALVAVYGTDFGVHKVTFLSRFTDSARQAASYRKGRVLLAGDAAHVHSPAGGQGVSLGVQDAVNLGWKLAQVVKGISPESLLDTYQAERHPIAARALRLNMAATALNRGDERATALRELVSEMLAMDEPRKRYAAILSGLEIHYDAGAGHPLLGRRMPDLDVITASGPRRVFTFLHEARAVLLNLSAPLDIAPWAERVQRVDARYAGPWELPMVGAVPAPAAVLIRPDGYVAWVGDGTDHGLQDALSRWFGPAVTFAPAR